MTPISLLDRRLMLVDSRHVFRIVALDDSTNEFIVGKRGQSSQRMTYAAVIRGLLDGVIVDVTVGRPCAECGGHMTRQVDCRIEELRLKLIKGYHVRGSFEKRVYTGSVPVWLCDECEHVEEER